MDFNQACVGFDRFLNVERNLSPGTRQGYAYDLYRFGQFMGETTIDLIDSGKIRSYLEKLKLELNYAPTTLSRVIASIRCFFKWCLQSGYIQENPSVPFHNPKQPRKLPIFLNKNEAIQLLESPQGDYWTNHRDKAMLHVFAFTGIRLQELVKMNVEDIDFDRQTIRVMGKGAKERIIPMSEKVILSLIEYLKARPETESTKVFLSYKCQGLSCRGVQEIVKKLTAKAEVTVISPHKLRHTFATLLHDKGVDILEIQTLLGHESITSTQIYTHTSNSKLSTAVRTLDTL